MKKAKLKKHKDVSTMFTKNENMKNGRKGYLFFKQVKQKDISPDQYGMFLQSKGRR